MWIKWKHLSRPAAASFCMHTSMLMAWILVCFTWTQQSMLCSFCAMLVQSSYISKFGEIQALKALWLLHYSKVMHIQQEKMASFYFLLQNFRYLCSNKVNQRILLYYKFWSTRHKTCLEDSIADLLLEKLSWLYLRYYYFFFTKPFLHFTVIFVPYL